MKLSKLNYSPSLPLWNINGAKLNYSQTFPIISNSPHILKFEFHISLTFSYSPSRWFPNHIQKYKFDSKTYNFSISSTNSIHEWFRPYHNQSTPREQSRVLHWWKVFEFGGYWIRFIWGCLSCSTQINQNTLCCQNL